MKLKARSSVARRAVALGLGVVIALTGTTAMNSAAAHAADEPKSLKELILGFFEENGFDSINTVLGGLTLFGVGDKGPSLEEISALLDEKLGDLEGRFRQIVGDLRLHTNAIDAADVKACVDVTLTYGDEMDTLEETGLLPWFAVQTYECVAKITNRIVGLTALQNPLDKPNIDLFGMWLGFVDDKAEDANLRAGFSVRLPDNPGTRRSGLSVGTSPMDFGVIEVLRSRLVEGYTNVKTALAPDCGTRELHREGQYIEVERYCQAFNGTRATYNEVIVENQQRPPFDFTELRRQALVGTASELADLVLPEAQKPVAAVGCDAVANTLSCEAVNADPLGTAVSTTRYWVNGAAVPAWNDDLSNLSTSCVPGTTYTVRLEITNTLGYRDDVQTQLVRCAGNRALGRPATADSSCTSTESAAKAVNGLSSGVSNKWCSVGATKWLQVNLQGTYRVESIIVRHAGAGGEPSGWNTRDFNIRVSTNGTAWTTVATVVGNAANVTTHAITPVDARYVRLEITRPTSTSDRAARVYEVEVYI
jgi:hypothetical protein